MAAGNLVSLFSAAGLAGASGHRAFIPALCLGGAHHLAIGMAGPGQTPFFQLSEQFAWLADPIVMLILGALTVIEILAESNPDAPELVNLAMKAPKAIAGFIVVAATTGQVTDSMTLMVASGVLGSGTALTVDSLRADVKHTVESPLGEASDGLSTRLLGIGESIWAGGLAISAIVWPLLAIVGLAIVVVIWLLARRAGRAKFTPCPHCKEPRHPEATACPHCRRSIGEVLDTEAVAPEPEALEAGATP